MATRKIIIVDSAASKKITLSGEFNTFGDVLTAARNNGVDTVNKDFMEGITKTIFNRADALLPTDIPYKGRTTNDLVFSVTASNKNIKSGHDRNELKVIIQTNNLSEAIKSMFNKPWTNCSNAELEQAVNNLCGASQTAEENDCNEVDDCFFTKEYDTFVIGIAHLLANLDEETLESILQCVNEIEGNKEDLVATPKTTEVPEVESPYSDEELEDILNNL